MAKERFERAGLIAGLFLAVGMATASVAQETTAEIESYYRLSCDAVAGVSNPMTQMLHGAASTYEIIALYIEYNAVPVPESVAIVTQRNVMLNDVLDALSLKLEAFLEDNTKQFIPYNVGKAACLASYGLTENKDAN